MNKIEGSKIITDLKQIVNKNFKITVENIPDNYPLFNGGFSLSSIQIIELTVAIENFYHAEFDPALLIEDNFRQLDVLADVIINNLIER